MHQKVRIVLLFTSMLLMAARLCPAADTIPFKPEKNFITASIGKISRPAK